MDPITAFVIATAFALLNGAVLGFVHSALSDDLKPSASDWRIGTLLVAGGGIVLAANGASRVDWLIPVANGCLLGGIALYTRSIRRYAQRKDSLWVFVPAIIAAALNAAFALVWPSVAVRLVIVSLVMVAYLLTATRELWRHRRIERTSSGNAMIALCSFVNALILARLAYYIVVAPDVQSITTAGNIVNGLSPALISAMPVVGTTVFALMCFERMRDQMQRVASTDALTQLPNRRTINERAASAFSEAKRTQRPLSIAVIDVDHFKNINDQYGHEIGDVVLRGVADALAANCRGFGMVGRQGGEEFVALFDDAGADEAQAIAERLRAAIADSTVSGAPRPLKVTVSVGVASSNNNDASFNDLLRRADRALYEAKAAGRNLVR